MALFNDADPDDDGPPEPRTARQIAEQVILSHTEDIEYLAIGEMMLNEYDVLGEVAFDALQSEVDDLIRKAVVTVTWPSACASKLATGECPDHDPQGEADHG